MKIFVDTANVENIQEIVDWGVVDGVTTNPTLVAREDREFKEILKDIADIVNGPISAEVIAQDSQGMIQEARDLDSVAPNIAVKIPMTEEGLSAVNVLSQEGIDTNVTLVFSAQQALLAARAGATYVSPFMGRLDDIGGDGIEVVADTVRIFEQFDLATEVIAASVRHPKHVLEAAKVGAHIATIPYDVCKKMIEHPLTDSGLQRFLADWERATSSE